MPCQCPPLWPIIQVDFESVIYLLKDNQLTRAIDGNPLSPTNGMVISLAISKTGEGFNSFFRSCVLRGRILTLRQDPTHLYYRAIFPSSSPIKQEPDAPDSTAELIRDYFNLSVDLTGLYEKWSSRDSHFKKTAPKFTGIRMLRQDPWENLISFICSSNNNIIRISQMVLLPLHSTLLSTNADIYALLEG